MLLFYHIICFNVIILCTSSLLLSRPACSRHVCRSWKKRRDYRGNVKNATTRFEDYFAATCAYRQVATAIEGMGRKEEAETFAFRAQVMQRKMLWWGTWRDKRAFWQRLSDFRAMFGCFPGCWRSSLAMDIALSAVSRGISVSFSHLPCCMSISPRVSHPIPPSLIISPGSMPTHRR